MPDMNFGVLLRRWRTVRRISQLDLALDAEISSNASSELCRDWPRTAEPGDGPTSAEALQVPLRERNALLLAAGYAPLYRQINLDAPEAEAARRAVELLMAQLEPYPVLVLDRYWNTLRMNAGAKRFLALFPGCDSGTPHNGVRLVFHPQGLRPFIENWEVVAARIIRRVHREAVDNPYGRDIEAFPGGVAQLSGRAEPLADAGFGWRSSTVLDHQLQVEELNASSLFSPHYLGHAAGRWTARTPH